MLEYFLLDKPGNKVIFVERLNHLAIYILYSLFPILILRTSFDHFLAYSWDFKMQPFH